MAQWLQRTVHVPPAEVLLRLTDAPKLIQAGLRVGSAGNGTLVAGSRRYSIEREGVVVAWVELTPLTPGATLVEAWAETTGDAEVLRHIEAVACGPVAPRVRAPARHRSPWQRPAVRLVAVIGVLTLVAGSAAAYRLLAPPEPLPVDQAVAQFQQMPASTPPVAVTAAPDTSRASGGADTAPPARVDRVRRPPAPGEATASHRAPGSQTAAIEEPRSHGRRPAAEPQRPRRRDDAAQPAPLPEPGVYTYATSGHEEIDQPHDRHDYPAQTALTVHHDGCGFTTRWQPLEQRWDETEICGGQVRTLARMTTQREFFGRRQRSDYRCEPRSRAWSSEAGAAWTTRCSDGDTTVSTQFKVLGHERVTVGDATVGAVHLRLRSTVTGNTRGQWTADRWLHPDTGLLLRLQSSTDATSTTPFGEVRYREQVRLDLQSLEPRR